MLMTNTLFSKVKMLEICPIYSQSSRALCLSVTLYPEVEVGKVFASPEVHSVVAEIHLWCRSGESMTVCDVSVSHNDVL